MGFFSQAGASRADVLRGAPGEGAVLQPGASALCVQPPVPPFTSATAPSSWCQTTPGPIYLPCFYTARCSPATRCPGNAKLPTSCMQAGWLTTPGYHWLRRHGLRDQNPNGRNAGSRRAAPAVPHSCSTLPRCPKCSQGCAGTLGQSWSRQCPAST